MSSKVFGNNASVRQKIDMNYMILYGYMIFGIYNIFHITKLYNFLDQY